MADSPKPGTEPTIEAAAVPSLSATLTQEGRAGDTTAPSAPAAAGTGRWERGRELGRGGMGRVVEAVDRQFNRVVAIKEMHGPGDAAVRRRFTTEALVTGNLEHAGIPSVYERGVDERGVPWYAMRRVRGCTMGALLAETKTLGERLALLNVIVKTAQTLGYAQEHGVIHRDVKPDNIVVGPYGEVVLLDWGIARVRGVPGEAFDTARDGDPAGGGGDTSTVYGSVIGTPSYMAPEQAEGATDRIDERTDVFALGALLYHVLTGRAPFGGSSVGEAIQQARDSRPRPVRDAVPEVPEALALICARAMARRPEERYRSATELATALEEFESAAILAKPASPVVNLAVNVVVGFAVVAAILTCVALVKMLPAFFHLGTGAYFTTIVAAIGAMLSVLEWITRGRHSLSTLAFAFAFATLCGGLANVASGLGNVFEVLESLAGQPEEYRRVLAVGAWESVGGLTLGAGLAGAQFLLCAIAQRRARLSEVAAAQGKTTMRTVPR